MVSNEVGAYLLRRGRIGGSAESGNHGPAGLTIVVGFLGGSAYAMSRDVAEGYHAVTARTFEGMTRSQLEQLAQELDKHLREVRGNQVPLDDLPAIQKRNRKISRLNNALMILRTCKKNPRR